MAEKKFEGERNQGRSRSGSNPGSEMAVSRGAEEKKAEEKLQLKAKQLAIAAAAADNDNVVVGVHDGGVAAGVGLSGNDLQQSLLESEAKKDKKREKPNDDHRDKSSGSWARLSAYFHHLIGDADFWTYLDTVRDVLPDSVCNYLTGASWANALGGDQTAELVAGAAMCLVIVGSYYNHKEMNHLHQHGHGHAHHHHEAHHHKEKKHEPSASQSPKPPSAEPQASDYHQLSGGEEKNHDAKTVPVVPEAKLSGWQWTALGLDLMNHANGFVGFARPVVNFFFSKPSFSWNLALQTCLSVAGLAMSYGSFRTEKNVLLEMNLEKLKKQHKEGQKPPEDDHSDDVIPGRSVN